MTKPALTFAIAVIFSAVSSAGTTPDVRRKSEQVQTPNITFTENNGQVSDQNYKARPDVLYSGSTGSMVYHLRNNGISYQLNRVETWKEENDLRLNKKNKVPDHTTTFRLDINWLGYNNKSTTIPDEAIPGYTNYYLTVCPEGVNNVKTYTGVTYKDIYKKIDLHYYEKDGDLKYDFILAPGGDFKEIKLEISGAEKISLNNKGELVIKTPLGKIIEQVPLVLQNGKILKSKWFVNKNNNQTVSFDIDGVDPKYGLVIDPLVRVYGTYYGGSGEDLSWASATDQSQNVYLAGSTLSGSGTSIATSGSHQSFFLSSSNSDAYLAKFNSFGQRQWATYYGSVGVEQGRGCATDANGNVYLAGSTESNGAGNATLIATPFSHQSSLNGVSDAFLVKFNSLGVRQWGTYYGGNSGDDASDCCTDAAGNVFLIGSTSSTLNTSVATLGSHQANFGGGLADAFIAKFNTSGTRIWGSYYGGSGLELGYGCTCDPSGNVFLNGYVDSNQGSAISSPGAQQVNYGGSYDAFLVKFNSAGVRQWGTYYGGAGDEIAFDCATDASGNVYLAGDTYGSGGFSIATPGSHQPGFGGGTFDDAFLVKFAPGGARLWGTYYGGTGAESACRCFVDQLDNPHLYGSTSTNSGLSIATPGSHQSSYGGGQYDAFIAKFDPSGVRTWGSYYGGSGSDIGQSGCNDSFGYLYLTGNTTSYSGSGIATSGSHQASAGGGPNDAFLVKLRDCPYFPPTNTTPISNQRICQNSTATLSAVGTGSVYWYNSLLSTLSLSVSNTYVTPVLNSGVYTYYVESTYCVPGTARTAISVTVNPPPFVSVSGNSVICLGESGTMSASGAVTYTWDSGNTGASISVSPTITTSFTVTGTDANNCTNFTIFTLNVDACSGLKKNIFDSGLKLFPNPNKGIFNLELVSDQMVTIMNTIGQIVYSSRLNSGQHQIDLYGIANGIYILKVEDRSNSKFFKFTKE